LTSLTTDDRVGDRRDAGSTSTPRTQVQLHDLVADARLELLPTASLERAVGELRAGSRVSMTCSPTRSIEATLDATAQLVAAGHDVTPHLSARMVRDHRHLVEIAARLADTGARRVFVVGGDADPPGAFADAVDMLDALLSLDPQVDHVGLPCYPDGHPLIAPPDLHSALHRKQELILSSGRTGHVTTQMCFAGDTIRTWLRDEHESGLVLPLHLGIAGPIDRTKLVAVGVRLGVGPSLRYVSKNRRALTRLLAPRPYRPDRLLRGLVSGPTPVDLAGLHVFTFNQVAAAEAWRDRVRRR
jgi:methylenetetrahydrofolate reductase (NADPH)